jgi:hypothetical protein
VEEMGRRPDGRRGLDSSEPQWLDDSKLPATGQLWAGVQFRGGQSFSQAQQLVAEDRGVRWPAGRLFGHRLGHQRPHHPRNVLGQWGRLLQQMGQRDRDRMLTGKGATAGQTLIGHHPQGIQVAGRGRRLTAGLLGRQVARRATSTSRWSPWPWPSARATPKSVTFTLPSGPTSRLGGLTSRCTSPTRWAAPTATAACPTISRLRSTPGVPPEPATTTAAPPQPTP